MNQRGFSLIEILVALVLVGLIVGVAISNPFSSRQNLEDDLTQIERAIRYMNDEAALKNTIVRFHAKIDGEKSTWALEYGPSENFILPTRNELGEGTESLEEEEKRKEEEKKLNMNFNKISDFNEEEFELKSNVRFIGLATNLTGKLIESGSAHLYAFPGGDKDQSLILLATDEEMVSLEIEAFTNEIKRTFYLLKDRKEEEYEDKLKGLSQEIYKNWEKDVK